jgi:flavin-dependent dehydrogenase
METVDVIIVGGGPAGSSCAWRLGHYGVDCLVLDKAAFPRTKLCAGWITPEVVADLEFDIATYPHRFLSFDRIHFHFPLFGLKARTVQHSIRRCEFDAWLLERSAAEVRVHEVRTLRRDGEHFVIDNSLRCRYLVGAGGTRCPVFRSLFRDANPRARELQAVTLEQEFPYSYGDPACHLWFLEKRLPGYSWYVPKADGYLNVGVGGMATRLKQRGDDIKAHWQYLTAKLMRAGLVRDYPFNPGGYSYFIRDKVQVGRLDNAFIAGDAAGLATRDMGEGIGPAVRSGLMAAESIARGGTYRLHTLARYSTPSMLLR